MKSKNLYGLTDIIKNNKIFCGLCADDITALSEKAEIKTFTKGQAIRDSRTNPGGICFIISGSASVLKGKIIINTITTGDTFGAADLYKEIDNPLTDIIAASECKIAVLSKNEIDNMISRSPAFAKGYISYLSGRIAFLTGRIETVTGGSAAENLKTYILAAEGGCIDCSNMSLLAKKLDMSRATLYRTVAALESEGLITRENDKIILLK